MNFSEYAKYDGTALAEMVEKGETNATELLSVARTRHQSLHSALNAITCETPDVAQKQIEKLPESGSFTGVPFLLKDLDAHINGVPTTNGSELAKNFIPTFDSELFRRYQAMGLVTFGKTNTPEFGLTITTESALHGACRNPWCTDVTTGGSSGGAAAAVAAGVVPMAHASDGGGSIRVPAACCGLFGLMPSRARNPVGPNVGEGWSGLVRHHVLTQTVRDSARALVATQGYEKSAPYFGPPDEDFLQRLDIAPQPLRIKFYTQAPNQVPIDPEVAKAVQDAAQLCESLGHRVEEAPLGINASGFGKAFNVVMAANTQKEINLFGADLSEQERQERVEAVTWQIAQQGLRYSAVDYAQALGVIHRIGAEMANYHSETDIVICPVLTQKPFSLGYMNTKNPDTSLYFERVQSLAAFTSLANASGQPAMSVPLFQSSDNLPIGVQFMAGVGQEGLLLRLARQLEIALPWRERLLAMQQHIS